MVPKGPGWLQNATQVPVAGELLPRRFGAGLAMFDELLLEPAVFDGLHDLRHRQPGFGCAAGLLVFLSTERRSGIDHSPYSSYWSPTCEMQRRDRETLSHQHIISN